MSDTKKVYVADDYGFVGFNGQSVRLDAGMEFDIDDPIVRAMPERFTAKAPEVSGPELPRRGRPLGSKNKPRDGASG
jgi:hypothetical protein